MYDLGGVRSDEENFSLRDSARERQDMERDEFTVWMLVAVPVLSVIFLAAIAALV